MKKMILLYLLSFGMISTMAQAESRTTNGLSDVEKLAITAGAAKACGVDEDKLRTYEMIASRIIVNPTKTPQEEKALLKIYAQKKLDIMKEQQKSPEMDCSEVLVRFNNMSLFKSTVYRDGTLKLPDGKVIKPVRPITQGKK